MVGSIARPHCSIYGQEDEVDQDQRGLVSFLQS